MGSRPTKGHEDALWRGHSGLLRRDSSRRPDIETSLDAAA